MRTLKCPSSLDRKQYRTFHQLREGERVFLLPRMCLRSECPVINHLVPMSFSCSAETSPVKAPPPPTQAFCADIWIRGASDFTTCCMYIAGGATTMSTSSSSVVAFRSDTSLAMDSCVPLHFQFPPTKNLPVPTMTTTPRLLVARPVPAT